MTKEAKKLHCAGCENNFYNGFNNLDIKECWSLSKSKLVMKKQVGIDDVPPWNHPPKEVLSCYHKRGYVFVAPNQTC